MKGNKIIALSGQPVTGKGSTVVATKSKLMEQGYSEENINIISTGDEFRHYFKAIFEFIKNYDDVQKVEELSENPYLKKFVDKPEYRDILIETLVQLKENRVGIDNLTIFQANTLKEFGPLRDAVDKILDIEGLAEKGKELASISKPNEIWIIDSRLALNYIPEAFSVRLISNPQVAAERYFNAKRGETDSYNSIEEAYEAREKRRIDEQNRYIERYGIDLEDENNYDLIIDTSYSSVEDISDTILKCFACYREGQPFAKKWASPKTFLPLQTELTTLRKGEAKSGLEEMEEDIRKNGYEPSSSIEIIEADGIRYLINGHHRNFGQARNNKTLVPYEVIATDDEKMPEEFRFTPTETARNRAATLKSGYLYGHEWLIGETFSYNEIYPGIYEKLKEQEEVGESR